MKKIKEYDKRILNFNDKKKFLMNNLFCIPLFMLCIFVSIFLINSVVIFSQDGNNNNIVNDIGFVVIVIR